MASIYGVPHTLFPDSDQLRTERPTISWERNLFMAAFDGYKKTADQDRELARFMVPTRFPLFSEPSKNSFIQRWGSSSWLATSDKVPFVPEHVTYFHELYKEPRSLAHLIGCSYQRFLILYCADDGEIVLPSPESSEVLLIVVKQGVTLMVQDSFSGELSSRLVVGALEEQSRVTFIQDQSVKEFTMQHDRWHVASQAELAMTQMLTGGQSWLRKKFILGEKAQVSYTWLTALQDSQQAALTTVQHHKGPESSSQVLIKSALTDQARSFYRGTIKIDYGASGSEADQQQRALMLSPSAKTCAIPSLEVATHDVQCQHGSAAGKFQEQELWYLASRGLSSEQSKSLLLEGFFNEPGAQSFMDRLKKSFL